MPLVKLARNKNLRTPDFGLCPNDLSVDYPSHPGLRPLASPGFCCPEEISVWLKILDTVESPFIC